jgi:hypothetical protein
LENAAEKGFAKCKADAARPDVNESFFLHGLPKGVLADVLRSGFNERYAGANAGSLFGAHVYAAVPIRVSTWCEAFNWLHYHRVNICSR